MGGEVLLRRAAKGRFRFDYESRHPNHFMMAAVTGVAPFLSIGRDFVAAQADGQRIMHRLALVQASIVATGFGYLEEMSEHSRKNPWFRYIPTVSRTWCDTAWAGGVGRADDILRKKLDAPGWTAADTTAYFCGNPGMIQNGKGILRRAGFGKESMKEEQYRVETRPTAAGR